MYFDREKLNDTINVLDSVRYSSPSAIDSIGFHAGQATDWDRVLSAPASVYAPFENGGQWIGKDVYDVFLIRCTIPEEFQGMPVVIRITTGCEAGWEARNPQFIVWTSKGLQQGVDINHREIMLADYAHSGEHFEVVLEGWTGLEKIDCIFKADLIAIHPQVEALYYDLLTATEAAFLPKQERVWQERMSRTLLEAAHILDLRHIPSESFYNSVNEAHAFMQNEFFKQYKGNPIIVSITGHSHIDVAWQWCVHHSRKKAVRSFATAMELMRQYPDFIFSSSQPLLYENIKEDEPLFYEELKKCIAKGQFEPEGAMWVEADCNLISGESFVRQIAYGKRFFQQEFGINSRVLWLPDVFGYSAAMPQIMKKCGVDYFITSKISWNEYNRMPHDTFYWRGIDGSKVLTYLHTMPDADEINPDSFFASYNGQIFPRTIAQTWERYRDAQINENVLASFGFGDGGGGPTRRDLEIAARLKDGLPGVPKVQATRIFPYMQALEKRVQNEPRLATWSGELYLEFHRGTYTSVARIKKLNRQAEIAMQQLELASLICTLQTAQPYPHQTIHSLWKIILRNQFHDILPGSSIHEVYQEAFLELNDMLKTAQSMTMQALCATCSQPSGEFLSVWNALPLIRSDILLLDDNSICGLRDEQGTAAVVQRTYDKRSIAFVRDIPSMGFKSFSIVRGMIHETPSTLNVTEHEMENDFYCLKFDECKQLLSLWDKREQRELLSALGNQLIAYEDRPRQYDAWEITVYYRDKEYPLTEYTTCRVLENGPVRACVEVVRSYQQSVITQHIYLYANIARIDFETVVDWHESHTLLKAVFPLAICADKATFDIAYGNIERPTHSNTSWDFAKFEVCAHQWADISERGYGAALLNNCKYGYRAKDGTLEITLIKSATFPDSQADQGAHTLIYSLYPHQGDFAQGQVVQQAALLNSPAVVIYETNMNACYFSLNVENLYIDATKFSDDSNGTIVRLHEFQNKKTSAILHCFTAVVKAYECDLLENVINPLAVNNGDVYFEIQPYEIKTIRLLFSCA